MNIQCAQDVHTKMPNIHKDFLSHTPRKSLPKDPRRVQTLIDRYFSAKYNYGSLKWTQAPSWIGLALFLGLKGQAELFAIMHDQGQEITDNRAIIDAIHRACSIVASYHEERVAEDPKCVGSIFALKQIGWQDKSEVRHSGELSTVTRVELPQKRPKGAPIKRKRAQTTTKKTKSKA